MDTLGHDEKRKPAKDHRFKSDKFFWDLKKKAFKLFLE
jgi:hypothetical protein